MIAAADDPNKRSFHVRTQVACAARIVDSDENAATDRTPSRSGSQAGTNFSFVTGGRERPGTWLGDTGS